MTDELRSRLEDIFRLADHRGPIGLRVVLDAGGEMLYVTEPEESGPMLRVTLNGELEHKAFRMFRWPDIESDTVKAEVRKLLSTDAAWKEWYLSTDPYYVRSRLRAQFKEALIAEASALWSKQASSAQPTQSVESSGCPSAVESTKPIYKSRTILANIIVAIVTAVASELGITITPEEVAAIFATMNTLLRLITSKPIRVSWR